MQVSVERRNVEHQLRKIEGRLEGLYDAIADGLARRGLKTSCWLPKASRDHLRNALSSSASSRTLSASQSLPALPREGGKLHSALDEPETKTEAAEILRGLIEQINVTNNEEGIAVELIGDIVKLVALPGDDIPLAFASSVKVVAGARNRRYLTLWKRGFRGFGKGLRAGGAIITPPPAPSGNGLHPRHRPAAGFAILSGPADLRKMGHGKWLATKNPIPETVWKRNT